ncbi:MAG: DUF4038 domain-containing protein, partial [bacterium]|nr:DUF4038 domain-containing protein [bacterium]
LHLIPYGEDTEELRRYGAGDPGARFLARYAQARFSAFPNVFWCISNDREIVADDVELRGRRVRASTIAKIGRDMAVREPWGTLLTNHQSRFSGYWFVSEPWSDVITIEDLDQVAGEVLLKYRAAGRAPVVNDEDRYENYRFPKQSRYFFRRLMWASLLSGGSATYGGLRTYEPYDGQLRGVQGYYDAVADGKLHHGAHDFVHIHKFFRETGITLVGMEPDDALVGGDPLRWKLIRDARNLIVYLANPTAEEAEIAGESAAVGSLTIKLPEGSYQLRWFDPSTGGWRPGGEARGGLRKLFAPGPGDWVLLASAQPFH